MHEMGLAGSAATPATNQEEKSNHSRHAVVAQLLEELGGCDARLGPEDEAGGLYAEGALLVATAQG